MGKHKWFSKKKKEIVEVEEEPAVSDDPVPVFKRRSRKVEEEKVATAEEVKEVIKPSIFKERIENVKERDYLEKRAAVDGALYKDQDSDDEADEDILDISKRIADAFELSNYREATVATPLFETEPEVVEEEEPIEEPADEPVEEPTPWVDTRRGMDVIERLREDTEAYEHRVLETNSDFCEVLYNAKDIPKAITEDGKLKLANYKVYVNGVKREWDDLFEIRVKKGSRIDVETGVSVKLPATASLVVEVADATLDKFALRQPIALKSKFSAQEALEPLMISFIAEEGAYLSKIGRVVECQIVA